MVNLHVELFRKGPNCDKGQELQIQNYYFTKSFSDCLYFLATFIFGNLLFSGLEQGMIRSKGLDLSD